MGEHLALDIAPPRRIDVTLGRVEDMAMGLSAEQQAALMATPQWSILVTISRLRGMEMAEEPVRGRSSATLADAYDRVVSPGEHAVDALLRTFTEVYG